MPRFTYKQCDPTADRDAVIDFLAAHKEELYLPDRAAVLHVVDLCFRHGGVIASFAGAEIGSMMGFFWGEPQCDYANKEVAFMYVATISPRYRLTRLFYQGLLFALRLFQEAGVQEFRLQAEASNAYTNKLYGRFAQPLGKSKSLRGKEVITYGGRVAETFAQMQRPRRARTMAETAVVSPKRNQYHA